MIHMIINSKICLCGLKTRVSVSDCARERDNYRYGSFITYIYEKEGHEMSTLINEFQVKLSTRGWG